MTSSSSKDAKLDIDIQAKPVDGSFRAFADAFLSQTTTAPVDSYLSHELPTAANVKCATVKDLSSLVEQFYKLHDRISAIGQNCGVDVFDLIRLRDAQREMELCINRYELLIRELTDLAFKIKSYKASKRPEQLKEARHIHEMMLDIQHQIKLHPERDEKLPGIPDGLSCLTRISKAHPRKRKETDDEVKSMPASKIQKTEQKNDDHKSPPPSKSGSASGSASAPLSGPASGPPSSRKTSGDSASAPLSGPSSARKAASGPVPAPLSGPVPEHKAAPGPASTTSSDPSSADAMDVDSDRDRDITDVLEDLKLADQAQQGDIFYDEKQKQ